MSNNMKRIHLLPNVITAFGLSCGLFVIFKMNMTNVGEANLHVLMATTGILVMAAFADLLDGAVARAMKAESEFGGLFDSLADAISFGVAPSVIILKSLSIPLGTEQSYLITTAAMVYSVCGVLRLVRFNVMSNQTKQNQVIADANNKNFTGLPIPAAAAAAVSLNLFLVSNEFRNLVDLTEISREWILFFAMIVLGYLMISRWKFPSLKSFQIRVKSFQMVFLTVLAAVFIFYGILNHFSVVLLALSWLYLIVSWILSLVKAVAGKKLKTLEDFEPEPEDELDNEN
jgi:CDP-diacylglycerol--serine O-phosphatidyltransferase